MSARDKIFAKLNAALDGGEGDANERASAAASRIRQQRQDSPIPKIARIDGLARIDAFVERAEAVQATVKRIASPIELPLLIAEELRNRNMPPQLRVGADETFVGLEWSGLDVSMGPGRVEEPATLSWAFGGMAETGTLAFLSSSAAPSSLNFLGDIHFAVVNSRDIEAGFEGLWRRFREADVDPRTVNLITGPSRTGDIEQKIELGAHGPTALHIFVIDF